VACLLFILCVGSLANALEAGKSMDGTTLLVKEHRQEDGSESVAGAVLSIRVHFPWIRLCPRLANKAKETKMEIATR
jgi:hypothetical protein